MMEIELCSFCGEKEGTEKIANPNLDMNDEIDWKKKENWWMVCSPCKKYIIFNKCGSPPEMLEDDELLKALENSYTAIIDPAYLKKQGKNTSDMRRRS